MDDVSNEMLSSDDEYEQSRIKSNNNTHLSSKNNNRSSPTYIISISAGSCHSCAIIYNFDILCWGLNRYGQSNPKIDFKSALNPL